jgi:hypothetical protein
MKRYHQYFRIETNKGRVVGHANAIEAAEFIASRGRGRWVFRWFEDRYIAVRQY